MAIKKAFIKTLFSVQRLVIILAVIGVVFVLLWVFLLSYQVYLLWKPGAEMALVAADTYQAVFLTNDQIYFGHLLNIKDDFMFLDDVYYVKIEEQITDTGTRTTRGRLIRLGETEPHGPRNQMIINREQVLFWENLSFESQIYQSIQSYNNLQKK